MKDHPAASQGEPEPRIPVTIVGGYLGAGKTTLINRMLHDNAGQRLAILVNDFGSINVDAGLIAAHNGRTISLTNGCACCSIAGDLVGALVETADMKPRPDRIVIETSGVADPNRVANYVRGHPGIGVDGIVVLADTESVQALSADRFVGRTVRNQLAAADLIVMTKTDLVTEPAVDTTRAWLGQQCEFAPVVGNAECDVVKLLLVGGMSSPGTSQRVTFAPAVTDDGHAALTVACPEPVDRARAMCALQSLAGALLRCKGWLRFVETPDVVHLVQGVGARLEFSDVNEGIRDDQLGLVIICRDDGKSSARIAQVIRNALSNGARIMAQAREEGTRP